MDVSRRIFKAMAVPVPVADPGIDQQGVPPPGGGSKEGGNPLLVNVFAKI